MSQQDDSPVPTKGRILAIDPGERRIGVAGADLGLRVAIPLTTIEGGPDAVEAVARLVGGGGGRARGGGRPLAGGARRRKRDGDALAAAIILQAYLDSQRQPAPG